MQGPINVREAGCDEVLKPSALFRSDHAVREPVLGCWVEHVKIRRKDVEIPEEDDVLELGPKELDPL
jgi:hypothetical protein